MKINNKINFGKWNSYADYTYSSNRRPLTEYPMRLGTWLKENIFLKTGKIADFGCGRGDYLDVFSELGFEPYGLDISERVLDIDKHHVKQVDFVNDKVYISEKMDFIFTKSVIEHLHDPSHFLSKMLDTLKDQGKVVIMTPSWAHSYWGPFYIDHTHVTPFTKYSLRAALGLRMFKSFILISCPYYGNIHSLNLYLSYLRSSLSPMLPTMMFLGK